MLDEDQQIQFTKLWTDAQPTIGQYVASLIRDHWAVRDILQNTSMAVLRKFSEYDPSRPFLPWALGVAKFEILGHRRDAARDRMVFDSAFLEHYTQTWAQVAPRINDEASALRDCVSELKGRPRTIIMLRYADGQTSETIAAELKLSAANVRTILKRVREALKQCVEKRMALSEDSA
jgi:RNA polymerase sigma-70 factor, ECF subfamily